jgi:hypothetical protein
MDKKEKKEKEIIFNYGCANLPGRGFGNLNISNDIRNGDSSRSDTQEYREKRESQQIFDFQFSYLDRNFQDPRHIVMPIPRGGEPTRVQNQLEIDPMRDLKTKTKVNKKIEFKY